ncbi:MAG: hypothetical protein ACQETH_12295, partial [Candidatus Rifleibacteriota bacterium]
MVEQIYENAETTISPRPMSGGQYYDWHNSNNGGNPLQNLTAVQGENYVDYSHGVRLVSKSVV